MPGEAGQAPTFVYEPASQLSNLPKLFAQMWNNVRTSPNLAWVLVKRDFQAGHRELFLGWFWMFIGPIGSAVVFATLANHGVLNLGKSDIPYPLYVLTGNIVWGVFIASQAAPEVAMASGSALLNRIQFPIEALVLSSLIKIGFKIFLQMALILVALVGFGLWPSLHGVLLYPLSLIPLILIGLTLGMFLTPLSSLFKDVKRIVGYALLGLFFLTPVVFVAPKEGLFALVVKLNPLTYLLHVPRDLITTGTFDWGWQYLLITSITIVVLLAMWVVYHVSIPILVERRGA